MFYYKENLCMLLFLHLGLHATAKICHLFPTHKHPELLCNGFVDILHLDEITEPNVTHLSFSKNSITTITDSSFNFTLGAITHLYLDNNLIRNIPANAFKNLPNVQFIDLSNNKLKWLDTEAFASNTELIVVDLTGNKMNSLDVNVIKRLPKLEKIILSGNPLDVCNKATEETLEYLAIKNIETHFLSTCEVSENKITKIPRLSNTDKETKVYGPITFILLCMVLFAFSLGCIVAVVWLRLRTNIRQVKQQGRVRTESEKSFLPKDQQRLSKCSGLDEEGYEIPIQPENPAQYIEVLPDAILLNHRDDLSILNSQDKASYCYSASDRESNTYKPNHVYEEVGPPNTANRKNYKRHLVQPYSHVKIV